MTRSEIIKSVVDFIKSSIGDDDNTTAIATLAASEAITKVYASVDKDISIVRDAFTEHAGDSPSDGAVATVTNGVLNSLIVRINAGK